MAQRRTATLAILALVSFGSLSCGWIRGGSSGSRRDVEPVYDTRTGRLQLLKYDADADGTVDTFSYMDGSRIVRIEIDADEDGTVDRWEYYDANQELEKVGVSRRHDGVVDAWSYARPDGSISRIDISRKRDGHVDRIERYERLAGGDALVEAEDDTDGDGRADKWEGYEGDRLAWVAFDTNASGRPDRRLVYERDGDATVEVDADEDGTFTRVD